MHTAQQLAGTRTRQGVQGSRANKRKIVQVWDTSRFKKHVFPCGFCTFCCKAVSCGGTVRQHKTRFACTKTYFKDGLDGLRGPPVGPGGPCRLPKPWFLCGGSIIFENYKGNEWRRQKLQQRGRSQNMVRKNLPVNPSKGLRFGQWKGST